MEKNVIQINGGIMINADVSVENAMCVKKIVWNPATCSCEKGKYLASIIDDSAIMCNGIIKSYNEDADAEAKSNDEAKSYDETNFNEKNITCRTQNFYILSAFSLITIVLLIAVSIYCYLIKYRAKQKHYYHFTNDPKNIKIDEKSYKNIFVYYIGYVTIKDSKYVKIYIVNPLYLIFDKVNGYFEEINGNKYLTPLPTNEGKEKIKKYEELWRKIKDLIRLI